MCWYCFELYECFLTWMVSMVTSVSLAASSRRGLIVSRSSCILLTSSAVLRSYRTMVKCSYTREQIYMYKNDKQINYNEFWYGD